MIAADTKILGLAEAREKLRYYNMTKAEGAVYDEHLPYKRADLNRQFSNTLL
ncbi:MAG: hypothetical protein J6K31_09315 [Parabacteroides sp.]|nr:hypothetical protein [Parabacteroides sp.]